MEAVAWSTEWIPDQPAPATVVARWRTPNGLCRVAQPLEGERLPPRDARVVLLEPQNRPNVKHYCGHPWAASRSAGTLAFTVAGRSLGGGEAAAIAAVSRAFRTTRHRLGVP